MNFRDFHFLVNFRIFMSRGAWTDILVICGSIFFRDPCFGFFLNGWTGESLIITAKNISAYPIFSWFLQLRSQFFFHGRVFQEKAEIAYYPEFITQCDGVIRETIMLFRKPKPPTSEYPHSDGKYMRTAAVFPYNSREYPSMIAVDGNARKHISVACAGALFYASAFYFFLGITTIFCMEKAVDPSAEALKSGDVLIKNIFRDLYLAKSSFVTWNFEGVATGYSTGTENTRSKIDERIFENSGNPDFSTENMALVQKRNIHWANNGVQEYFRADYFPEGIAMSNPMITALTETTFARHDIYASISSHVHTVDGSRSTLSIGRKTKLDELTQLGNPMDQMWPKDLFNIGFYGDGDFHIKKQGTSLTIEYTRGDFFASYAFDSEKKYSPEYFYETLHGVLQQERFFVNYERYSPEEFDTPFHYPSRIVQKNYLVNPGEKTPYMFMVSQYDLFKEKTKINGAISINKMSFPKGTSVYDKINNISYTLAEPAEFEDLINVKAHFFSGGENVFLDCGMGGSGLTRRSFYSDEQLRSAGIQPAARGK